MLDIPSCSRYEKLLRSSLLKYSRQGGICSSVIGIKATGTFLAIAVEQMGEAHSDEFCQCQGCVVKYSLLRDEENPRLAIFERRLPCCGCGIGWSSFLLGFVCPLIWYFAATLYCCKYYNRDPRERPGLAASAVAALIFTVLAIIALTVTLIISAHK